jgi:hypothetical protein
MTYDIVGYEDIYYDLFYCTNKIMIND